MEKNQNPFIGFEQLLNKSLSYLKSEFFEFYENAEIVKTDSENGFIWINHAVGISGTGDIQYAIVKWTFEDYLSGKLAMEKINASKVIDSDIIAITKNGISIETYLNHIFLRLKNLKSIANQKFPNTGIFTKILEELNKDILLKYTEYDFIEIKPDFNNNDFIEEDFELVERVLGYLKGKNDAKETIMSESDYVVMKKQVLYFIEHESLPAKIEKLSKINISNNLLRFTFWVLHKHLYTNVKIKNDFILLLKNMFSNFDDTELDTLKKKFGNRDKVTVGGLKYIPEIIKREFKHNE